MRCLRVWEREHVISFLAIEYTKHLQNNSGAQTGRFRMHYKTSDLSPQRGGLILHAHQWGLQSAIPSASEISSARQAASDFALAEQLLQCRAKRVLDCRAVADRSTSQLNPGSVIPTSTSSYDNPADEGFLNRNETELSHRGVQSPRAISGTRRGVGVHVGGS